MTDGVIYDTRRRKYVVQLLLDPAEARSVAQALEAGGLAARHLARWADEADEENRADAEARRHLDSVVDRALRGVVVPRHSGKLPNDNTTGA